MVLSRTKNTKRNKIVSCSSIVRTRADQVTVSHSVHFTSTGFLLGAQLVVTVQGENIIFVPLRLAHFTLHDVFQIPLFNCN